MAPLCGSELYFTYSPGAHAPRLQHTIATAIQAEPTKLLENLLCRDDLRCDLRVSRRRTAEDSSSTLEQLGTAVLHSDSGSSVTRSHALGG